MTSFAQSTSLQPARDAVAAGAWREALELFQHADADGELEAEDLERFGDAAFWTGRVVEFVSARERAYRAFLERGDNRKAAQMALYLAFVHAARHAVAVSAGWLGEAVALLSKESTCSEQGWLSWVEAVVAGEIAGDLAAAIVHAERTIDIGRELSDRDVEALGQLAKGAVLVRLGRVEEGVALLDRVMTLAVSGALGGIVSATTYCGTIGTCAALGDYKRAAEWTDAVRRGSTAGGSEQFPGDCRLHRAELLRLRGEWSDAEVEAARACEELADWDLDHVALGLYELGELSLRRGDLPAAEEAFHRAEELGRSAQPGRAFLELARGRSEVAFVAIREALESNRGNPLVRAQLLPVATAAAIGVGELEAAAAFVDELAAIATTHPSDTQSAQVEYSRGLLQLARGMQADAVESLRDATERWNKMGAPYESARAEESLALGYAGLGDTHACNLHLTKALATFERLGAPLDVSRVLKLLGRTSRQERVFRTFIFTDIEDSTGLLAAMGDDDWAEVLGWHDAAVRQVVARFRGEEVKQRGGGDGFFLACASARAGIDCAVAIQQVIAAESSVHDVPIRVRIGVHEAEATRANADYGGRGVHEAARIAALATGGEILVSTRTLQSAGTDHEESQTRSVTLRGLPGEMEVTSLPLR